MYMYISIVHNIHRVKSNTSTGSYPPMISKPVSTIDVYVQESDGQVSTRVHVQLCVHVPVLYYSTCTGIR